VSVKIEEDRTKIMCFVCFVYKQKKSIQNLRFGRSIETTEREFEIKLESESTKMRYEDSSGGNESKSN
jgi:hypothetical protein